MNFRTRPIPIRSFLIVFLWKSSIYLYNDERSSKTLFGRFVALKRENYLVFEKRRSDQPFSWYGRLTYKTLYVLELNAGVAKIRDSSPEMRRVFRPYLENGWSEQIFSKTELFPIFSATNLSNKVLVYLSWYWRKMGDFEELDQSFSLGCDVLWKSFFRPKLANFTREARFRITFSSWHRLIRILTLVITHYIVSIEIVSLNVDGTAFRVCSVFLPVIVNGRTNLFSTCFALISTWSENILHNLNQII